MCKSTIDDIRKGKGLKPLPNSPQVSVNPLQSDVPKEQQDREGITYETFSLNKDKKTDKG